METKMKGQMITTNLRYTREQLDMLFDWARLQDVKWGGRYEVGGGGAAISVWTRPWIPDEEKTACAIMGTFSVIWVNENRIYEIKVAEDYTEADMLHELAILEREALGKTIHER